jgi:hypothetical protein
VGPRGGIGQGGGGRGSPESRVTTREGWRWWLDGVLRQRWSSAAGEGGDEVLQLEEGMEGPPDREERGAQVELTVGENGSGGGLNATRGGVGSATSAYGSPRGRRGGVLVRMMRKRMREERERGHRRRRCRGGGRPGVAAHDEEVGERRGGGGSTAVGTRRRRLTGEPQL